MRSQCSVLVSAGGWAALAYELEAQLSHSYHCTGKSRPGTGLLSLESVYVCVQTISWFATANETKQSKGTLATSATCGRRRPAPAPGWWCHTAPPSGRDPAGRLRGLRPAQEWRLWWGWDNENRQGGSDSDRLCASVCDYATLRVWCVCEQDPFALYLSDCSNKRKWTKTKSITR